MYISHYTDKLLDKINNLEVTLRQYEAQEPIKAMKAVCDSRIRAAQAREKRNYDSWMKCVEANKELKKKNTVLWKEKEDLKSRLKRAEKSQEKAEHFMEIAENCKRRTLEECEKLKSENAEKDAEIEALKSKIMELQAKLDHDSTTSGIPTSKTPIDKKKRIPNTRTKTGRKKGGQKGHAKQEMSSYEEIPVTGEETYRLSACPECGGELEELTEDIIKDELDYEVRVIRKRHRFRKYRCRQCGRIVHAKIPEKIKEACQYGANIQAMLLALLDLGFVSMKRARMIAAGMLKCKVLPSEGYVGKVQKKAARMLTGFLKELKGQILKEELLYWDDTVVYMDTRRACIRFYGNERLALYRAHWKKNAEGIEDDGILANLGKDTHLMHDHVKYNYRKEFLFKNIECVQHLERDLQQITNDSGHKWSGKLKDLISGMIHKRKVCQKEGKTEFTDEDTNAFEEEMELILSGAEKEIEDRKYWNTVFEENVLKRIREYRENYFAWVYDFDLPTTNNLSESSLRMTKTKLKVSGQFGKEETAAEFAAVRSYTETCKRNGVDEFKALQRLMMGNPYTVAELLGAKQ